ncbi:MAG: hypothetical protein IH847_08025 [Acidobacteria bacterium]|nr:hypothetical protein [Acidobacteriota bacterium]
MIDDQLILGIERLRDDLGEFKSALRRKYKLPKRQVTAQELKKTAAQLAEKWLVNYAPRSQVADTISSNDLGNLNVHFQRLLTFSEQAAKRSRYDDEIKKILNGFTLTVIVPLKQMRGQQPEEHWEAQRIGPGEFRPTAFLAHSFDPADQAVVGCVTDSLGTIGIKVFTGEKPRANRISEKVKKLIDEQYLFVGVFTRREKLSHKNKWNTSPWVIDEKAYAVAKGRKLILLKEAGVDSIGGIQGDYEFVEFSRKNLAPIPIKILQIFDLSINGLRP